MMVYNYQQLPNVPMSLIISLLMRNIRAGLNELIDRSRPFELSLGHILRSLISAITIVTRWTLVFIQVGIILLWSGFESYSNFVKTDIITLSYLNYRTYQPILNSIKQSGFNYQTYEVLFINIPWIIIYSLLMIVLCIARGTNLNTSSGLSEYVDITLNTDLDQDTESSPLASYGDPLPTSNAQINAARTVDDDRFSSGSRDRNSLRSLDACVFFQLGFIWCLHPTCSLRGTVFEIKRAAVASWFNVTANGIPLAILRTLYSSLILSLDYIIARTRYSNIEADNNSLDNYPLYRLYNYIHGLTGLERRQSQIPSDFESIPSYQYGSTFDGSEESLNEVIIEP